MKIINFEEQRLLYQFSKFKKTGEIPECIYAGNYRPALEHNSYYYAAMLFAIEKDTEYIKLMKNISVRHNDFKLLYTISRYKKGIDPISALYEELQKSLFNDDKTKFDVWLIQYCKFNLNDIINNIETDLSLIDKFLGKYQNIKTELKGNLAKLVSNLTRYLDFFKTFS